MNANFFVPFEMAQKLKEKGYDEKVSFYYTTDGVLKSHVPFDMEAWVGDKCFLDYSNSDLQKWHREENFTAVPTYHEVLDWLEGRKVRIYAEYCNGWWYGFIDNSAAMEVEATVRYQTREEAIDAAILKALEIL